MSGTVTNLFRPPQKRSSEATRDLRATCQVQIHLVASREALEEALRELGDQPVQFEVRDPSEDPNELLSRARSPRMPTDSNGFARRLPVTESSGKRIRYVKVGQIDWIEAENQYMRLHVQTQSFLVRMRSMTLQSLEQRLDPEQFQRVHRSHIVNLDRVISLHLDDTPAKRFARLTDGSRVPVSQTHWERLQEALTRL